MIRDKTLFMHIVPRLNKELTPFRNTSYIHSSLLRMFGIAGFPLKLMFGVFHVFQLKTRMPMSEIHY